MFARDTNTTAALRYLDKGFDCFTSVWAAAEVSSALSLQVRMGRLQPGERENAEARLDQWLSARGSSAAPMFEDHLEARALVRTCRTALRAPDALHLALCRRLDCGVATFDLRMFEAAQEIGLAAVAL